MTPPQRQQRLRASILGGTALLMAGCCALPAHGQKSTQPLTLEQGFRNPPVGARLRCYWWWLNGHTTKAAITRDLEQMAKMGYGGALLVDANGADQNGNDTVPAGPQFGSPAWTELYLHALKEAHRLGIEITLNIMSGWNLGGPEVKPEDASKLLTWSQETVEPGRAAPDQLGTGPIANGFYRQIAVLAYPLHRGTALAGAKGSNRAALRGLRVKDASAELNFSMPATDWMLTDGTSAKDEDFDLAQVQNITAQVDADGHLHWSPPSDSQSKNVAWEILRVGFTDSDARVSTGSDTWHGLAIDYLDPHALDTYWDANVEPLLKAARPYAGNTLKYVATDSWELGGTNWTYAFREEFIKRRGYDPVPYLPIVAGRIAGSRDLSTRFLNDLRRTVADLVNTHYDHMAERAKAWGMGTQCESGGPHGAPYDALETFRSSAVPQTEFWAMSKEHRSTDADRFFVKEASSAAHIYGRPFAAAEGETSIGNQWSESLGGNLRPSFDRALTEGMNRLVWHEFTSSPPELGLPGQEYFAGTHLNPNVTWWHQAAPFFAYLNRSQFLMQQGKPVSDVLYYYGDNAPNFARLKSDDPAKVLPGYDYDVTDTDALLKRMTFPGGKLQTPEGIRYRAFAMPASRVLPLAALRWVERYVDAGGTVIGARPLRTPGIGSDADEREFQIIADKLWKSCETSSNQHADIGRGHVYCTSTAHEALAAMQVLPDFEELSSAKPQLDFIHRTTAEGEVYFVRNTLDTVAAAKVVLRTKAIQPKLFHADTGEVEQTLLFSPTKDGRMSLPLALLPYESIFVVVPHEGPARHVSSIERDGDPIYSAETPDSVPLLAVTPSSRAVEFSSGQVGSYKVALSDGTANSASASAPTSVGVGGPWTLSFPAGWGAPSQVPITKLQSWTLFEDPGIRYFSGSAKYRTTVDLSAQQIASLGCATLSLGDAQQVATVRINDKEAGTLWKFPYALSIKGLLHEGANTMEIEVTNLWPNRLIGDAQDPAAKHYTWTNIRKYTKDSPLLPSGLMGPVWITSTCPVKLAISHLR